MGRVLAILIVALILAAALVLVLLLLRKYQRLDKNLIENQEKLREAVLVAEEASRAKSNFLANMSHEIRTPMHGIIGFTELALDSNISPAAKEDYLRKIRSSAEGLLQIIDDILDISKIEAGRIELESIPFNMHEVFRTCQTIITPTALEKGISLYCYAEPSVGKKLLGDPTRLNQVLLNLLSNAVKFTNTGMVKLLSEIVASTEDSVTMRFEVKDSGIGMTPEQIQRIFDPFMQADITTTRKYGGTGLGLAISKDIIELMGGQLSVKSEPGIGSRFTFDLTFKALETPADFSKEEVVVNKYEKPIFKGEILLCEDNEINRQVIQDHLARVGINTVAAVNGKEGVEIVRRRMENSEKPFDLIFMDIHMPVMDGLEAAQTLARLGNQTPIVALTANVMVNDRATYQTNNILDYLAKPFKSHELWACLTKYLTPVDSRAEDANPPPISDEKKWKRILTSFVRDHQTTAEDITAALEAGDLKLAHRLAHTLKGLAGLIGETALQKAAQDVELALDGGAMRVTEDQLNALERELNIVLGELAYLLHQPPRERQPDAFDIKKVNPLYQRLDALLAASDSDCLDLTDELRDIPGTEALIQQIEAYEFGLARKTLAGIK